MPKLLVNNNEENVLSTIINELHKCKTFTISVAFITEGGLASLKSHLYDLDKKVFEVKLLLRIIWGSIRLKCIKNY